MRTRWVVVLTLIAVMLGSGGAFVWRGASSSIAGMRVLCQVLATAQSSGIMSKAQVDDVIDRAAKRIDSDGKHKVDSTDFTQELKAGCPTLAVLNK